jgi:hypothetical protein
MPDQIHSYVDEAGDPTLFGRKRGSGVIVGNDGCSKFFIMGKLEVADSKGLSEKLTNLRHELLADPYFAGVESFKPERPKTAHGLHGNNDLPEVRYQVFKLLRELGSDLRFHAVVADKTVIAAHELKRREHDPNATVCLQAVDYFLWAVQRFYERREIRFLDLMWPQIGEIHDLDHGKPGGAFYKGDDRPALDTVFPRKHEEKKK